MSSVKWRAFCLGLNVLKLANVTPYLSLMGELWGEHFVENTVV